MGDRFEELSRGVRGDALTLLFRLDLLRVIILLFCIKISQKNVIKEDFDWHFVVLGTQKLVGKYNKQKTLMMFINNGFLFLISFNFLFSYLQCVLVFYKSSFKVFGSYEVLTH